MRVYEDSSMSITWVVQSITSHS